MTLPVKHFPINSIRGNGTISAISLQTGQYVCTVTVNDREVLSKIRGKPWTVAEDIELWQLADAACALCQK